jgi:hypothetical protein
LLIGKSPDRYLVRLYACKVHVLLLVIDDTPCFGKQSYIPNQPILIIALHML